MIFTNEIVLCHKCSMFENGRLKTFNKPYVKFQVEEKWKPEKVKVLFIAESPPWNGKQRYFYNPTDEKRTNLRKEVLKHLNLKTLTEFKKSLPKTHRKTYFKNKLTPISCLFNV